ncbi:hypothetical protein NA78x_004951 [Anatilimnocola sp. NA78]|uniref:hypothetical protein n=1 Tax=Anatilimnocola sp. NA78 TaxID=3415683 RepID=UPI003CE51C29
MENENLSPSQVLGHVLAEIRQVCEDNVNGLDWTTSYFVLESGVSFALPGEWGEGLCRESLPAGSVRLSGVDAVAGKRIAALLRPQIGADIPNESLYLLFEDGYLVTDITGAYHGTSSTGIYIFPPGEIDMRQLVAVWGGTPPAC